LEKPLRVSVRVVLATVITPGSAVGISRQSLVKVRVMAGLSLGLLESVVLLARS